MLHSEGIGIGGYQAAAIDGGVGGGGAIQGLSPVSRGAMPSRESGGLSKQIDSIIDMIRERLGKSTSEAKGSRGGETPAQTPAQAPDHAPAQPRGESDKAPAQDVPEQSGAGKPSESSKKGGAEGASGGGGAGRVVPPEVETLIQMLMMMLGSEEASEEDKGKIMDFLKELLKMADESNIPGLSEGFREVMGGAQKMLEADKDFSAADSAKLEEIIGPEVEGKSGSQPMPLAAMLVSSILDA